MVTGCYGESGGRGARGERESDSAVSTVHVLMREEKERRKKQARSNKQQGKATQHTQGSHLYTKTCHGRLTSYILSYNIEVLSAHNADIINTLRQHIASCSV